LNQSRPLDGKLNLLPFQGETDFEYSYYGGWKANQEGSEYERNILVIIPGKNRGEAVVLADHYDTAYMGDVFDPALGGSGARLSAAGADDNYSATAALLVAAPIFLAMSREGKLERDIWLLHLTGQDVNPDSGQRMCMQFPPRPCTSSWKARSGPGKIRKARCIIPMG
jgi:hypothetical protein